MTTQEAMGLRIKSLREEKKMSQTTLAELVGYKDKTAIAKVEAGKVDLPQSKISAFAKALGTTTSYLFSDNTDNDLVNSDCIESDVYYLNDDAREMAQFMFDNPEYKVLFDASRKVSKDDIDVVKAIMDKFKGDN